MTHEDGFGPYPPHDLAPELDDLSQAYARSEAEIARLRSDVFGLRTALEQQQRATEAEQAARAIAEADNAALIEALAQSARMFTIKGARVVINPVLAEDHPGTALLSELEAAQAVVAAAHVYQQAIADLNGIIPAETALWIALSAYDAAAKARTE